jgi:hypothetical protein
VKHALWFWAGSIACWVLYVTESFGHISVIEFVKAGIFGGIVGSILGFAAETGISKAKTYQAEARWRLAGLAAIVLAGVIAAVVTARWRVT